MGTNRPTNQPTNRPTNQPTDPQRGRSPVEHRGTFFRPFVRLFVCSFVRASPPQASNPASQASNPASQVSNLASQVSNLASQASN